MVRWFHPEALPGTLFPWYRQPIADALADRRDLVRYEHQGVGAICSAMAIDLRMRWTADRAGQRD